MRREQETNREKLSLLQRIATLEEQRHSLRENEPCPLCGAVEHPFANKEAIPQEGETAELIEQIKTLAQKIEAVEKLEELRSQLAEKERERIKAINEMQIKRQSVADKSANLKKRGEEYQEELEELKELCIQLAADLRQSLQPFLREKEIAALEFNDEKRVGQLLKYLKKREEKWREQENLFRENSAKITAEESECKEIKRAIAENEKRLAEHQERSDRERQKLARKQEERKRRFGEKEPEKEEERLQQQKKAAEKEEGDARRKKEQADTKYNELKTLLQGAEKQKAELIPRLAAAEKRFQTALSNTGFKNEEEFKAARVETQRREKWQQQKEALQKEQQGLAARYREHQEKLSAIRQSPPCRMVESDLQRAASQLQEECEQSKEQRMALQQKLVSDTENRINAAELQQQRVRQQSECARWRRLNHLVGSHDGAKYRNFAQGLSFELLVAYANKQLTVMGGVGERYILQHDPLKPLELNVMDTIQAGVIRPTTNLSGGESFLVSLALALGLAKMASNRVQVDSLFLDEGFGALDEESLDTALTALSGLQQEGKLIGIISHIGALQERIPVQIEVIPQKNGRSVLGDRGERFVEAVSSKEH